MNSIIITPIIMVTFDSALVTWPIRNAFCKSHMWTGIEMDSKSSSVRPQVMRVVVHVRNRGDPPASSSGWYLCSCKGWPSWARRGRIQTGRLYRPSHSNHGNSNLLSSCNCRVKHGPSQRWAKSHFSIQTDWLAEALVLLFLPALRSLKSSSWARMFTWYSEPPQRSGQTEVVAGAAGA